MKLYLAGSSKEAARVASIAERVESIGVTIVGAWWLNTAHGKPSEWSGKDARLSIDVQRHIARGHMRNIEAADVFWLLFPSNGQRSTCFDEFGWAMAKRTADRKVIVTGDKSSDDTWTSLADYRDVDDLCGLAQLARFALEHKRARLKRARVTP